MAHMTRHRVFLLMIPAAVAMLGLVLLLGLRDASEPNSSLASTAGEPVAASDDVGGRAWPTFVNRPAGPPRVETGLLDDLGRPVTVSCTSCHANLEPNYALRRGEDLVEFHRGLTFDHGNLSCLTCHNANNYDSLRLADGSDIQYTHVEHMCAQCHSPQHRDFLRGAHGGMTGYWDRSRGPQVRKNCIDCHDPHAPAFPRMTPTFRPHDRFLEPSH